MHRPLLVGTVALVAFAVFILVRFPAQWAMGLLPAGASCDRAAGTVWRGSCAGLTVGGTRVESVSWDLHPARLFTGRVAADLSVALAAGGGRGTVELPLSGGALIARDLRATLPLDPAVLPPVPPGLGGSAMVDLASIRVEGRIVRAIEGTIEVRDLVQQSVSRAPIGNFRLTFPAGASGEPVGRLEDTGGLLDVEGTVRLTAEPGYALEGRVAARPDAPPELAVRLRALGQPDAQGRRPFSIAGTY